MPKTKTYIVKLSKTEITDTHGMKKGARKENSPLIYGSGESRRDLDTKTFLLSHRERERGKVRACL